MKRLELIQSIALSKRYFLGVGYSCPKFLNYLYEVSKRLSYLHVELVSY
ncbi:MAG: hypothetical protein RR290_02150 [Clostridia bacterium]